MQRSRFPSSGERNSLLREHALVQRPAAPRYKPGPSAIEFAFGATLICILAFSAVHAMGLIR